MQWKGEMIDRRDHESRSTDEIGTGREQGAASDSVPNASRRHLLETYPRQRDNGDERRYHDKRAGFFKCLPQDDLGEVDRDAYAMLLRALRTGEPADFETIPLSDAADRRLANPQAAYAFDLMSRDSWATQLPPAPRFNSAEIAAEIGEVYWRVLTRDIPFRLRGRSQHRRCHQ